MAQIMNQTTDTRFDSDFYPYSNDTSLQAYIERWAEGTYLQWKFDDNANREWDVEWVYLFILTFAIYLAAAAIINKIKQRKNTKNEND